MPSSGCQTSALDRKSTRLNSSHGSISYAVFCLQKKPTPRGAPAGQARPRLPTTPCPARGAPGGGRAGGGGPALPGGGSPSTRCGFFFFNDTATTEIYTLSLHDALPISQGPVRARWGQPHAHRLLRRRRGGDRKSTRLNSSHGSISYAVFCLQNKNTGRVVGTGSLLQAHPGLSTHLHLLY